MVFDEAWGTARHSDSLRYTAASRIASQARCGCSPRRPDLQLRGEICNLLAVMAPTEIGTQDEFVREWHPERGGAKAHDP